nr:FkbM family methyltransferase [Saccharopolyspora sp. HNM0983]
MRADPAADAPLLDGIGVHVDHEVLRDPGVGLSAFNAAQRELTAEADGYRADGSALRSAHFAGFQPQRPWLLSTEYADRPRVLLSEDPVLAGLCAGYRTALVEAGYAREEPYPFDVLPGGWRIPEPLRTEYLQAWSAGTAPASPFEPGSDGAEFLDWACAPADARQRAAGGSRWTAAVWSADPALRREHPDPFGTGAESFHEWCTGVGVASGRVPAAAVQRGPAREAALVDQLGVAILGSGRLAGLVRAAVHASGLASADSAYYPVVLRCEPDLPVPAGRYVVDVCPSADREVPADTAETWVLSEAARVLARGSGEPGPRVVRLPVPQGEPDPVAGKAVRDGLDLSAEFAVGAFADHGTERADNALGAVNAFRTAFDDRDDVRLLIAASGSAAHPEAAERLRLATAADPRVVLLEGDGAAEDVLAAADCVLSLHRGAAGEHNVLRLLEAAGAGVPVVAGEHGAVAELFGPAGAALVPGASGEPDVDAAADLLRGLAEDPEAAGELGERVRDQLVSVHPPAAAGEKVRARVELAYRTWRTKWAHDSHGQFDDPLRPLVVARHALHRAPDVGVGSRNAMAPALRKAVLKALGHYDEHIRDVLRSVVDGVERTASEVLRRQHEGEDGDQEAVRGELARLAQLHEQSSARLAGVDDGVVRARADLADQHRRLRDLESGSGTDHRSDALAERMDSLTSAVERLLDRMDVLEQRQAAAHEQLESAQAAGRDAANALQRTEVLQRIVLREHERSSGSADTGSAPVLCDAGLLRLPADDAVLLPWLSSNQEWDADVSALIDSLLEPDGVFVDVGAYAGYQTVRVLGRLGGTGTVVAVEPCSRSMQLLKHNVEVNVPAAPGGELVLVEAAAWDGVGSLSSEPAASGGVSVGSTAAESGGVVPAVRLDKELEGHAALQGRRLSVVHVDVGGRVHRALGGLVRLLRRDRPSVVCSFTPSSIEQLGDDPAAVLREFGTWGYELVPVGRTTPVSADDLLRAVHSAGPGRTLKLWLRPTGRTT